MFDVPETVCALLIVPYGIETNIETMFNGSFLILLIVPYGIETSSPNTFAVFSLRF